MFETKDHSLGESQPQENNEEVKTEIKQENNIDTDTQHNSLIGGIVKEANKYYTNHQIYIKQEPILFEEIPNTKHENVETEVENAFCKSQIQTSSVSENILSKDEETDNNTDMVYSTLLFDEIPEQKAVDSNGSEKAVVKNESEKAVVKNEVEYYDSKINDCEQIFEISVLNCAGELNIKKPEGSFRKIDIKDIFQNKATNNSDNVSTSSASTTAISGLPTTQYSSPEHIVKPTKERPFKCEVCYQTFTQNTNFITHRRVHHGENPLKCDLCDLIFLQRKCLKEHKLTHTDDKPYKCKLCEKSFACKKHLRQHNFCHTEERPYQCDECDKAFKAKWELARHRRQVHSEENFRCDICDKTFNRKVNRYKHRRSHFKQECEVCYQMVHKLSEHRRTHTGEKLYKCDVCDKALTSKSSLTKHQLRHNREFRFKCELCSYKCTSNSDLKSHVVRIHEKMKKPRKTKPRLKCMEKPTASGSNAK